MVLDTDTSNSIPVFSSLAANVPSKSRQTPIIMHDQFQPPKPLNESTARNANSLPDPQW